MESQPSFYPLPPLSQQPESSHPASQATTHYFLPARPSPIAGPAPHSEAMPLKTFRAYSGATYSSEQAVRRGSSFSRDVAMCPHFLSVS